MKLLGDDALERSDVVANCRMNRERNLTGSNGYAKEIGFNPVEFLKERANATTTTRWLDLCCGSASALIEAAQATQSSDGVIKITGVDLVVDQSLNLPNCLHLIEASLAEWQPVERFDSITCVHGLHYIGDKLGLITRAVSWLKNDG